jgi:hypothetical protein
MSPLVPGVYNSGSTIGLTGTLTLDGGGDPDAVFVFQAGSSLTTASASKVVLTNGAQACNVYWQVTSSATLGTGSSFVGNILALTSITDAGGSTVNGRLLARNGAVTLNNTTIIRSFCAPTISKTFSPASITAGGTSLLTITLGNINATDATLTSAFTDTLPTGVVIAGTPGLSTTCGGTGSLTADAGTSTITMPAGDFIPGKGTGSDPGSCTISVTVTAPAVGNYINTVPIGALVTSDGSNVTSATSTLSSTNETYRNTSITTALSSTSITVGSTAYDTATLSGTGIGAAGGTVTYLAYSDSACTLNAQTAGIKPVSDGAVTNSNSITFYQRLQ